MIGAGSIWELAMRRPPSVTVAAVLLILGALAGIASLLMQALHPAANEEARRMAGQLSRVPAGVARAIGFVGALINLASAVLLLRGRALGRTLYTAVGALMLLEAVATTRAALLPFTVIGGVMYAIFVFLLFRPKASAWLRTVRV